MRKPSKSQAEAIRYFATGTPWGAKLTEATYRVCVAQGWLEPIQAYPFHQATAKGRAAIGMES